LELIVDIVRAEVVALVVARQERVCSVVVRRVGVDFGSVVEDDILTDVLDAFNRFGVDRTAKEKREFVSNDYGS
jgi:hypothetical protein